MIGKTLLHYTVLKRIGSGGMGEVYLARDEKLKRNVALKILPPEVALEPDRMRRFEQEARVGRYYWNKRTREGFNKAIESFQQAIDSDREYALAYAGLADCYTLMPAWALLMPEEGHPKAKSAAMKALELDETLAEAHAALAHTMHLYDWDWVGAEKEYKRAISLNPGYSTAHHWYANCLSDQGRAEEAVAEKEYALQLDPLSLVINADLGYIFYQARMYDRAVKQLQKAMDLDSAFLLTHEYLGYVYEQNKMYTEAVQSFQRALQMSPENPELKAELGRAWALNGNNSEAEKILAELLETSKQTYVVAFDIAMIYDGLGKRDQAFEWLEKACEERSYQVAGLKVEPRVDKLRSDPRFSKILQRIKYP